MWVVPAPGMSGTDFLPPWVSDPDLHHGMCVTHVPWCMPGSLTNVFLWSRWQGKRSRNIQCMFNPQFWLSGKRLIEHDLSFGDIHHTKDQVFAVWFVLEIRWWFSFPDGSSLIFRKRVSDDFETRSNSNHSPTQSFHSLSHFTYSVISLTHSFTHSRNILVPPKCFVRP